MGTSRLFCWLSLGEFHAVYIGRPAHLDLALPADALACLNYTNVYGYIKRLTAVALH